MISERFTPQLQYKCLTDFLFSFSLVFRIVEYVENVARDLVLSGTTIAWYVTVVTNNRITYVLSVENATIENCRKTCFIVICAKGKKMNFFR